MYTGPLGKPLGKLSNRQTFLQVNFPTGKLFYRSSWQTFLHGQALHGKLALKSRVSRSKGRGQEQSWLETPPHLRKKLKIQDLLPGREKLKIWDLPKRQKDMRSCKKLKIWVLANLFLHLCSSFSFHSPSLCFAPCNTLGLHLKTIFFIYVIFSISAVIFFISVVDASFFSSPASFFPKCFLPRWPIAIPALPAHRPERGNITLKSNWIPNISASVLLLHRDMCVIRLLILWEKNSQNGSLAFQKYLTIKQIVGLRSYICTDNSPLTWAFQSPAWVQWHWRCWEQSCSQTAWKRSWTQTWKPGRRSQTWRRRIQASCSRVCFPRLPLHSNPALVCRTFVNNQF